MPVRLAINGVLCFYCLAILTRQPDVGVFLFIQYCRAGRQILALHPHPEIWVVRIRHLRSIRPSCRLQISGYGVCVFRRLILTQIKGIVGIFPVCTFHPQCGTSCHRQHRHLILCASIHHQPCSCRGYSTHLVSSRFHR